MIQISGFFFFELMGFSPAFALIFKKEFVPVFFLRSLMSKKSGGMPKAVFHAKQYPFLISHSGSLCIEETNEL